MLRAIVGLGANLGDRLGTMRKAAEAIDRMSRTAVRSHVYATAPVGPPQPEFLNAAMLVEFEGTPRDLLAELLSVETELGRLRTDRWGPRTIDLDILWIEGISTDEDGLTVPHPRLGERAFALAPMLELVHDARDPKTGRPYRIPAGAVRMLAERL